MKIVNLNLIEKGWVFSWEKKHFKNKKNSDLWIRFLKIYRKGELGEVISP